MPVTNKASAVWKGNLKSGRGTMEVDSGLFRGDYTAASRFENGEGTNPEELIAAAHAGCFSMALSHALDEAGFPPERVETRATISLEKGKSGFAIKSILLATRGSVPKIDRQKFLEIAEDAKSNCPVSKALTGVDISLEATLES
jgi:osmotically inducible protein OsmC